MFNDWYFMFGDGGASERKLSQQWISGCVCGISGGCRYFCGIFYPPCVPSFECHLGFCVSILCGNHIAERGYLHCIC